MRQSLIIMPGSPALIPELAPGDLIGAELNALIKDVISAELRPNTSTVEFFGSTNPAWYTQRTGSLAAWGAPTVEVSGGNYLPEILGRVLLAEFEPRIVSSSATLDTWSLESMGLLALDGPTGLSTKAPSALIAGAPEVDAWCREVLSGNIPAPQSKEQLFDASLREPSLWLELLQLSAALGNRLTEASLLAADISHGVGRYVAKWTIEVGIEEN